ncbi:MAG: hypothetical protein V2A73_21930 [Pseudomonadota bacterium]
MRWHLFEVLAVLLIVTSMVFFFQSVGFLAKRDYVAAIILVAIGVSTISVGKELARLALAQKD